MDSEQVNRLGVVAVLTFIAMVFIGIAANSNENYRKSEEAEKKVEDAINESMPQRLGDQYFNLGQYEKATVEYKKAIDTKNKFNILAGYKGLFQTYDKIGNYEEARTYLYKYWYGTATPTDSKKWGNSIWRKIMLVRMAELQIKYNKYDEAIRNLTSAMNIQRENKTDIVNYEQYLQRSIAYEKIGNKVLAAQDLQKADQWKKMQNNIVSESNTQLSESCYELGVRYGRCATRALKGLSCSSQDDIVIPERCRGMSETQRGINDGSRSNY